MTKIPLGALTVMAALLLAPAVAQAQTDADAKVVYSDIIDAVPGKFFDAASTNADLSDPNILVIGFNSGRDPMTWKDREFKASVAAFSYPSATDTISFVITAPDGYFIATVSYAQKVTISNSRTGRAFATTQLVVNGVPTEQLVNDSSSLCVTRVPMSITTSLASANAEATVAAAYVVVTLLPLPEPPKVPDPEPEAVLTELPGVPEVVTSVEIAEVAPVVEVPVMPVVPVEVVPPAELPGLPMALPVVPDGAGGGEGSGGI